MHAKDDRFSNKANTVGCDAAYFYLSLERRGLSSEDLRRFEPGHSSPSIDLSWNLTTIARTLTHDGDSAVGWGASVAPAVREAMDTLMLEPGTPEEGAAPAQGSEGSIEAMARFLAAEVGLTASSAELYAAELHADGLDIVKLFHGLALDGLSERLTQWGWDDDSFTRMLGKKRAASKRHNKKSPASRKRLQSPTQRVSCGSPLQISERLYVDHAARVQRNAQQREAWLKREAPSSPVVNDRSRTLCTEAGREGASRVFTRLYERRSPKALDQQTSPRKERAASPMSTDRLLVRLQREVKELQEFKARADEHMAVATARLSQQLQAEIDAHATTKLALEQFNAAHGVQKGNDADSMAMPQEDLEEHARRAEMERQEEKDARLEMISELRLFKSQVEEQLGEDVFGRIDQLVLAEQNLEALRRQGNIVEGNVAMQLRPQTLGGGDKSYNEPSTPDVCVQPTSGGVTPSGESIPAGLFSPPREGTLKVEVVKCSQVLPADRNGKSDVFVGLRLGKQTQKTKVQPKTLDPVFNETLEFKLTPGGGDSVERFWVADDLCLVTEVWDRDRGSSDDFLGEMVVSLAKVFEELGGWVDTTVTHSFALADPASRLSRSVGKRVEERIEQGFAEPYGTVVLKVAFVALNDDRADYAERDTEAAPDPQPENSSDPYKNDAPEQEAPDPDGVTELAVENVTSDQPADADSETCPQQPQRSDQDPHRSHKQSLMLQASDPDRPPDANDLEQISEVERGRLEEPDAEEPDAEAVPAGLFSPPREGTLKVEVVKCSQVLPADRNGKS
eukprot:COSAG02_NODE_3801_length_6211_cov_6.100622_4_plen_792_part_01